MANVRAAQVVSELRRRNAELAEAISARDQFISIAAHELRNPMAAVALRIQYLAQLVRSDNADKEEITARELGRIDQLIARYVKRSTMLLDITRVAAGKFPLHPTRLDLSAMVREMVEDFAPAARHAGSRLSADIASGVCGVWDRLALEQITDNILSNAVKFGAGRPVEVSLVRDRALAVFCVRDHGIGISKREQGLIFERFERVRSAQQYGGFGVGLWLVRELVDAMGGHIDIASTAGAGSTFTISLPLTPAVPSRTFLDDMLVSKRAHRRAGVARMPMISGASTEPPDPVPSVA